MKDYTPFLKDIEAFIIYIEKSNFSLERKHELIVETLLHDIPGMIDETPLFLPRVDGYAVGMPVAN